MVIIEKIPIPEAADRIVELTDRVVCERDRILIERDGRADVMLISRAEYESMRETLDVLSDPATMADLRQSQEDCAAGDTYSFNEVMADLERRRAGSAMVAPSLLARARGTTTGEEGGQVADETLYEHAGRDEGLHRLEEIFYSKALADPVLSTLFTERVPTHVDHLTWFTAESFGGPDRFTREFGFAYLIDVHRGLKITDEQRDRFVAAYLEALDEAGMPADAPFRQAFREHVEFGARVAQQNSWARTEAELHPLREVPPWNWPD